MEALLVEPLQHFHLGEVVVEVHSMDLEVVEGVVHPLDLEVVEEVVHSMDLVVVEVLANY